MIRQFQLPHVIAYVLLLSGLISCSSGQDPDDGPEEDMQGVTVTVIPTPGFGQHNDLTMVDDGTILICGYSGEIIRTTDAGNSWQLVFSDSSLNLLTISRLCDGRLYVVGHSDVLEAVQSGVIFRSSDNGESWQRVYTVEEKIKLMGVDCIGSGPVIAAGYGTIFRSDDGGNNWDVSIKQDLGGIFHSVDLTDQDHAFLTLGTGGLMVTGDGGTWIHRPVAPGEIAIYSLAPVTNELLYGAPRPGITRSTDGGETWNVLKGSPQNTRAISFTDSLNGVALGVGEWSGGDFGYNYGSFFRTTDGGRTWKGTSRVENVAEFRAVLWPEPTPRTVYGLTGNKLVRFDFDE